MLKRCLLVAFALLALSPPAGRAFTLQADVSSRETYVGVPVTLQITIEDAQNPQAPVVPDIPNVNVRSLGAPSQSSSTSFINGAVTRKVSMTYAFQLTPTQEGSFTIPAIEVQADGQTRRTAALTIAVTKSQTGDLLFVEITGNRTKAYVGEQIELTLKIWLRPYSDRRFNLVLREGDMWNCIDVNRSQWGVFVELLSELLSTRRRPVGKEVLRNDSEGTSRSYYLYELTKEMWLQRPGPLDMKDINIIVRYPTRLARSNDPFSFGGLTIADHRPLAGQAEVKSIDVLPIRDEGRPLYYNGAVGQYRISTTAKPTDVAVGDPITLTMTITGTGNLDALQAPPLADLPELTQAFKVPSETLAGEVQNRSKRFSQSIRAKSDRVAEIPAIPLAYFDPVAEQFVTVRSQPIPIQVKPAEKLAVSQIVDATGQTIGAGSQSLTEQSTGILANYSGAEELLSQQTFAPGWGSLIAVAVPPLLFTFTWVTRRHSDRLRTDIGFARRRRARREALKRLGRVATDSGTDGVAEISTALAGYVSDRCNLPSGGLTRATVVQQLRERQVPPEVTDQVDAILGECESAHYAGTAGRSAAELKDAALHCIERLERERFE